VDREGGNSADRLEERLSQRARHFAFFQLVHLLERATGSAAIGYQGPVQQELVRFRAEPSLAFPPGDLSELRRLSTAGKPDYYELTVSFLGLYGPASPLPANYTEAVIAADLDDTSRRDFLDYFHQRLLSFLYRGWKKYRYYANFAPGANDEFSQRVFALFGGRIRSLRDAADLDWVRLLSCAGLLAMVGSPSDAVERVVSHYFGGLGARVEPFVLHRVPIEPDQRVRLGRANSTLGQDISIGRTVADRSGKFGLVLGPMGWDRLNEFLPDRDPFRAVVSLVNLMLQDPLAFDLALLIHRPEIKRLTLGRDNPCRLGWTTWLGHPQGEIQTVRLRTA
jgi:type VI secretion system protein ImpH